MKTYTYSYQNGLCRGREVRPGTRQTWQASLTPRRIWPGTRPDGANARNGVGAYCIRPPNIPQGMNDHTPGTCIRHRWWRPVGRMLLRLLHGYPHQQTNGAQPPTNQHPTGPRARMDVPPRPYSTASGTRPAQGFALGYDPAPLQGARVPAPTNQTGPRARMTVTNARTAVAHSPPMVAPGGAYAVAPPTRVPT